MRGFLIYGAHAVFWMAFGLSRLHVMRRARPRSRPEQPAVEKAASAPHSRALVVVHGLAFGLMYCGVGKAVFGDAIPQVFAGQAVAGCVLIGLGAALACWALLYLDSWRLRATLDVGHRLATEGPFRILRHPIYMGLDLFAIGTALWIPDVLVVLAAILMCVGGDLRARAEEKVLAAAFGDAYQDYCRKTSRLVPGIY